MLDAVKPPRSFQLSCVFQNAGQRFSLRLVLSIMLALNRCKSPRNAQGTEFGLNHCATTDWRKSKGLVFALES